MEPTWLKIAQARRDLQWSNKLPPEPNVKKYRGVEYGHPPYESISRERWGDDPWMSPPVQLTRTQRDILLGREEEFYLHQISGSWFRVEATRPLWFELEQQRIVCGSQAREGKITEKQRSELLDFREENAGNLKAVTADPRVGQFTVSRALKRHRQCRNGHHLSRSQRVCKTCKTIRNRREYEQRKQNKLEKAAGKGV